MRPLVWAVVAGEHWWAVRQAAAWAGALALAVSVASFAPEAAFVWVMAAGGGCPAGAVRVPLDGAGDHVCVPARMAGRSAADLLVPPVFAGLSVGASACFVRALAIGRRQHDDY